MYLYHYLDWNVLSADIFITVVSDWEVYFGLGGWAFLPACFSFCVTGLFERQQQGTLRSTAT